MPDLNETHNVSRWVATIKNNDLPDSGNYAFLITFELKNIDCKPVNRLKYPFMNKNYALRREH